jgi:hypothetical protein
MPYRDDELRIDINEIKSDVAFLKANFISLVETLKVNITNDNKGQNVQEKNLTITPETSNFSLINSSDIQFDKLKNIVVSYDENLYNCKNKKLFIEFCHFAIGLVEEVCRFFLRKKFQELQDEKNQDILDAYSLLENDYHKRKWSMPLSIYVSREIVLKWRQQVGDDHDNYYLDADKGKYLSLIELEKGKIIFTLELCFVILFKAKFYNQKSTFNIYKYETNERKRKQDSCIAIQRQPAKSLTASDSLKIEYYYRLDNAREFRNIFTHNQSDKTTQEEQINNLKPYRKVDRDNYDGILEATQWLILQMDSALN